MQIDLPHTIGGAKTVLRQKLVGMHRRTISISRIHHPELLSKFSLIMIMNQDHEFLRLTDH